MSKLNEYLNLQEKKQYFEQGERFIDTKEEFNQLWIKLNGLYEQREKLFRGVNEAKYKLYTSSQRHWIQQQLHKQTASYSRFIERLIDKSREWNNSTVNKLLAANSKNEVFATLSYMQHFGVPTPLLDFSKNPFVGLFFAVHSASRYPSEQEIDYYCSLYIADDESKYYGDIERTFNTQLSKEKNDFLTPLRYNPIQLVRAENSNSNVVNQEGLFFYNNHPIQPIEEVYYENINNIKNIVGEEEFDEIGYEPCFAECINIHKGLREYILAKLKTRNIDEYYIYPDNNQLSNYAITQALAHDDTMLDLEKAKQHLKSAKLDEALDILTDYTDRNQLESFDETILLANRLNRLESDNRKGIMNYEEYDVERNKIAKGILEIISLAMARD